MNTLVVLLPQLLRYVGWMSKEEQDVQIVSLHVALKVSW